MNASTIHQRFEVIDEECARLWGYQTKAEALRAAQVHQASHEQFLVIVYDLMAKPGQPQEWDCNGNVERRRSSKVIVK